MALSEYRRKYLHEWRKRNRSHIRDYFRNYLHQNRQKVCIKSQLNGEYYGTSGVGRKYERLALQMLDGSVLSDSFGEHFDLLWNGKKIEVKMRNRNKLGRFGFTFKPKNVFDFALLFCVDSGKIVAILFVPSGFGNAINFNDRVQCKWHKYLVFFPTQDRQDLCTQL